MIGDLWLAALLLGLALTPLPASAREELFRPSERCLACHNGLRSAGGQDVSFGFDWRPSMMANSARDPYWQASVRREVIDHPREQPNIEDECAPCHLPMPTFQARARGGKGRIFSVLTAERRSRSNRLLGLDGVSCSVCHQKQAKDLGSPSSFTGNYRIDTLKPWGQRVIYGPFTVDPGRTRVMESVTEFLPTHASHMQESALCASCHTLYTQALDATGRAIGRLPEQVPYLEWQHSAYARQQTCQDCHLPRVQTRTAVTSVLGQPRDRFFRHVFRGANFFMADLLNSDREELRVLALPQELEAARRWDTDQLATLTARLALRAELKAERLEAVVEVKNLAGHKIPTAYPSRRMWLHLTVRDAAGALLFESGKLGSSGNIRGNTNDEDARRFEPHYQVINRPDQVQIYESIMVDSRGQVTTGLLSGVRYVKDNRLLPRGFDKASASYDISVRGGAAGDPDFGAGGDKLRYSVPLPAGTAAGPLRVEVELWYQPIGYRWGENLRAPVYRSEETARFLAAYLARRASGSLVVTRAMRVVSRTPGQGLPSR